ncbi:MAG: hypothetical protein ACJA1R_002241 [Flavobacteriales bacterium]
MGWGGSWRYDLSNSVQSSTSTPSPSRNTFVTERADRSVVARDEMSVGLRIEHVDDVLCNPRVRYASELTAAEQGQLCHAARDFGCATERSRGGCLVRSLSHSARDSQKSEPRASTVAALRLKAGTPGGMGTRAPRTNVTRVSFGAMVVCARFSSVAPVNRGSIYSLIDVTRRDWHAVCRDSTLSRSTKPREVAMSRTTIRTNTASACITGLLRASALCVFALLMNACGTEVPPDFVPDSGSDAGGDTVELCEDGATREADDGCNTCFCEAGAWSCTEMACPEPLCEEGETRDADDGCNTCSCLEGEWACTLLACPEPLCEEGETRDADDGCNTCICDGGDWSCTEIACPEPICEPGDTMQSEDGCDCVCDETEQWLCDDDCGVAPECRPGDTRESEDGCDCFCDDGGHWICDGECGPVCDDGDVSVSDCLACVCIDGNWACDEIDDCEPSPICEDGDIYSPDDCTYCECEDEDWVCYPNAIPECEFECRPGATTETECEYCFCTADGSWDCVVNDSCVPNCEPGDEGGADAAPVPPDELGCTECWCSPAGFWECATIPGCGECVPGDVEESECETCVCDDRGMWSCEVDPDCGIACRPGAEREGDCEYCFCDDTGAWVCVVEPGCGGECDPGDSFGDECEFCLCDDTGSWLCTGTDGPECGGECEDGDRSAPDECTVCECEGGEWACYTLDIPECSFFECEPGEGSATPCETCYCDDTGRWICEENPDCGGCPEDGADFAPRPCEECFCRDGVWECVPVDGPGCGFECEPGSAMPAPDGCNSCFCDDSGSWACTERACPPDDGYACETDDDCFRSGCSSQICASESITTTCEWREEYMCLNEELTSCGCNAGVCGFATTDAYLDCLSEFATP